MRALLFSHFARSIAICAAIAAVPLFAATANSSDTTTWKRMDSAILRVNDQPPKEWNLFREGKKTNALILQINERLLLIEIREQQVRDLDLASVKRSDTSVTTRAKNPPGKIIASSEWITRDIGTASRIHFKLAAESLTVDLELPQWLSRGVTY